MITDVIEPYFQLLILKELSDLSAGKITSKTGVCGEPKECQNFWENVKINTSEDKSVNNRIRCCRHFLRMNRNGVPETILYVTLRGKQMPEKRTEIRMGTEQRGKEDLGGS
jgi:hypothetical protein